MDKDLLWRPTQQSMDQSNLMHFFNWLKKEKDISFSDYSELWSWSVNQIEDFWETLWEYFDITHDGEYKQVLSDHEMPGSTWFEGTNLNYAEHVFRTANNRYPALIFQSESLKLKTLSWKEIKSQVSSLKAYLEQNGIQPGDRVAAYLPCTPEASVAFLATASMGGIWSSCSPDFGLQAVVDRFVQIEPTVLFAVDEYTYNGKKYDKREIVSSLVNQLPSLKLIIMVSDMVDMHDPRIKSWHEAQKNPDLPLTFNRVPFAHPLWILYSSGTTGLPKAIVHSQGGILLEQLKYGTFHADIKPGERCFWFSTTGWMMWNYLHGCWLAGATLVLYDGSPAYPDLNVLWKLCEAAQINHFGTSAGFILANLKTGIEPAKKFNIKHLRSIGSTGSTLPPEGFDWVYQSVKNDCWLISVSGGTDVCSAFVGGNPLRPVFRGQIQCRALGCKLEAFDEQGKSVTGEVGEMVITKPMPSMPVYFWNDPDFKRYKESYFETYPGIWRHGDWIEITPQDGILIYGRSDATLNRGGVRIGTSEIYRSLDKIPQIKDSLIICIEETGGAFWMPLFVQLQSGNTITEQLKKEISNRIRSENSPRHVPDEIIAVPDIPYTISGKKTETPIKKVLMGKNPDIVVNRGALRNPESIEFFINLYKSRNQ